MRVMSGMWSRMEERVGATCLEGREFKEKIISIMCLTLTRIWSPTKFMPEINSIYLYNWGFPSDSLVKNLPAIQEMQETLVWSLGQEDPLEEEKATCSSILAWRIPWTEEPGGLRPWGRKESDTAGGLRRVSHWPQDAPENSVIEIDNILMQYFEKIEFDAKKKNPCWKKVKF